MGVGGINDYRMEKGQHMVKISVWLFTVIKMGNACILKDY